MLRADNWHAWQGCVFNHSTEKWAGMMEWAMEFWCKANSAILHTVLAAFVPFSLCPTSEEFSQVRLLATCRMRLLKLI